MLNNLFNRGLFRNVYISVSHSLILKKKVKKMEKQKPFNWNQYHATAKFLKRYEEPKKLEKLEITEQQFHGIRTEFGSCTEVNSELRKIEMFLYIKLD